MSLTIAGGLFTGPFPLDKAAVRANQDPAIYAIVVKQGQAWDPRFHLLDVGETGEAGMIFARHPARARWEAVAAGRAPMVYFHAMSRAEADAAAREGVLTRLRDAYPEPNLVIRG
jgi:hypothetical protein